MTPLLAAIEVQLVSLTARRERASSFTMNQDMQRECTLLDSQIEALEKMKQKETNPLGDEDAASSSAESA